MKKNHNEIQRKGWSQLPSELVEKIVSKLFLLSDQVRFYAVCKNWLQTFRQFSNNNIVSLPWLVVVEKYISFIRYSLYEPSPSNHTNPTIVYDINLNILNKSSYNFMIDSSTHKYSWIFNSVGVHDSCIGNFLLFSPTTKKIIILPRLDLTNYSPVTKEDIILSRSDLNTYEQKHQLLIKSFSSKPDSPDCVFLVSYCDNIKETIVINIFRHGYKEWKIQEFCHQGFSFSVLGRMPVYIEGIFYFVSPHKLASYNVDCGEWEVEILLPDETFHSFMWSYLELFELNGELALIAICEYPRRIRMFNRSRKTWVPLRSLVDQSIFVSHASIVVRTIEDEGKSNYGALPNRIYYSSEWEQSVYSLESGKLELLLKASEFTKWTKANRCNYHRADWFKPPDDLLKMKELGYNIQEFTENAGAGTVDVTCYDKARHGWHGYQRA